MLVTQLLKSIEKKTPLLSNHLHFTKINWDRKHISVEAVSFWNSVCFAVWVWNASPQIDYVLKAFSLIQYPEMYDGVAVTGSLSDFVIWIPFIKTGSIKSLGACFIRLYCVLNPPLLFLLFPYFLSFLFWLLSVKRSVNFLPHMFCASSWARINTNYVGNKNSETIIQNKPTLPIFDLFKYLDIAVQPYQHNRKNQLSVGEGLSAVMKMYTFLGISHMQESQLVYI